MTDYVELLSAVSGVFGTPQWISEAVTTVPENFVGKDLVEYIRVSVIPGGVGINLKSLSGMLMVDIFIEANKGPANGFKIPDKLNQYLVGKSLSISEGRVVQFQKSSMVPSGMDRDNPKLFRYKYSIPFNLFGANN